MVSMTTAVIVCAVLGTMTSAPISRPNDCATSMVRTTADQLAKNAHAVGRRPAMT
jgi:hypothetical protein